MAMGVPVQPINEQRPPQNTPFWMDVPAPSHTGETRRGAGPASSRLSGASTVVFFGLIVVVVAAAGLGGIALWGPEKSVKNRTQFATNPPPPTVLPSLPESSADVPQASPPAESAAAAPTAPEPSAKKAKKKPARVSGKKTH
jgi:hypothetical protein